MLRKKCRTCSRSLFFYCHSLSSCIGGRYLFLFCHRSYKIFMLFFQQKKCLLRFFLSRSRSLSPFLSLSFAGLQPDLLFFSVFLLLYIPNLWTCWTMNLSWILIASVSALQDSDGYAIFRQNNFELHLGCHICWLSYFALVCLWCGRTVARAVVVRSRDYQIFSDG